MSAQGVERLARHREALVTVTPIVWRKSLKIDDRKIPALLAPSL
jgi:hypothetical protein